MVRPVQQRKALSMAAAGRANEAAISLLHLIALAEMAMQPECGPHPYFYGAYTDGEDETAEADVLRMTQFGFRPDPSVAFHIMRPGTINGVTPTGFVAFAAHNSVGSTVYTHNSINAKGVGEVREGATYGGVTITGSVPALFRYKYNQSTKTVEKMPNEVKFRPNPEDDYPARLVVTAD